MLGKKVAAIMVAVFLMPFFVSCNGSGEDNPVREELMRDGEWEGLGEGRNGMIKLIVLVENNTIVGVRILSQSESKFALPAENEIIGQVLKLNGLDGVDAVSGATLTSNGVLQAIASAINASKGIDSGGTVYTDTGCDVVVVGAGGAGLSAAIQAHIQGKDVIVLEKQGIVGGNTNSSTGGINAAETSQQRLAGIIDSRQLFYDDIMTGGHYLNNPSLVQCLTANAALAVDWLTSLGADLEEVGLMAGSSVPRTHRPKSGAAIGPHIMSVLYGEMRRQGIELRTRSRVVDLVIEDGKVCGVRVESPSGTYTIRASAVVVATGGFGANHQMLEGYRPELKGLSTSNHSGATGDAVKWVTKAGGALTQMEQIQVHPTGERRSHLLITEAVRGNGAVLVNEGGRRFANEMLTRDKLTDAVLAQKGRHAFIIFDNSVRESLAAIENYALQGLLVSAGTVSELAGFLNMPPQILEETMSSYAAFQRQGEDADFGRRKEDMARPLTEAPFYAIDIEPVIHHTMGGVVIDSKARVLDAEGKPVPGLFAAGEVTGGVHGGNRLGGNAVADIIVFGRIAGAGAADSAD